MRLFLRAGDLGTTWHKEDMEKKERVGGGGRG